MRVYQYIHVVLFVGGALLLFAALVVPSDALLAVSGVCLGVSGVMSLLGMRIALRGPLGNLLRAALETRTLMKIRLGAMLWVVVGTFLTAWGVSRLAHPPHPPPPPPVPPPAHACIDCE